MRCGTGIAAALPLFLSATVLAGSPDEDCSSTITKTVPETTSIVIVPTSIWPAMSTAKPTENPGSQGYHGRGNSQDKVPVSPGSNGLDSGDGNGDQNGNGSGSGQNSSGNTPISGPGSSLGSNHDFDNGTGSDSDSENRGGNLGSDNGSGNGASNETGNSSGPPRHFGYYFRERQEQQNGSDSGDDGFGSDSGEYGGGSGSEENARHSHTDDGSSSMESGHGSGGQSGGVSGSGLCSSSSAWYSGYVSGSTYGNASTATPPVVHSWSVTVQVKLQICIVLGRPAWFLPYILNA
ncbi:hypothetical protein J3459_022231 [Metarhizium acridum]|nr:hypothetical protein J3459_022231 [Metarhizium acridum]